MSARGQGPSLVSARGQGPSVVSARGQGSVRSADSDLDPDFDRVVLRPLLNRELMHSLCITIKGRHR